MELGRRRRQGERWGFDQWWEVIIVEFDDSRARLDERGDGRLPDYLVACSVERWGRMKTRSVRIKQT